MSTNPAVGGFSPPAYPHDRLAELAVLAREHPGGMVDLSVGMPVDPPPPGVLEALASSGAERGYPASIGTPALREAAVAWLARRFGVDISIAAVAACIGTKELVVGLPHWLRLRRPDRDTVLYPAVSYPSYAMGAALAGCRAVPVPLDDRWRLDTSAISDDDAARALCLWSNTPGNPAGGLDDLAAVADWGRRAGVSVLSDECYAEFTWDGPPRCILQSGSDEVLALHSLSKRSNLAGLRVGFYAGDAELVRYLSEVRKHAGFMVPGPVQAAAVVALADDAHAAAQAERYRARLQRCRALLAEALDLQPGDPGGGFYLWVPAPGGDAWALARRLATEAGCLVAPGDFYGPAGAGHVRLAMATSEDRLELVARRLGAVQCGGAGR
ncbi:MAG: aminotransferase class I/II-fold pyridoxal phosphate-dependent enzyme [Actinomycetota bacterium]|nr:aminotransferase class I/II-fold pyridoxal phosphate-dependent enzyme [Actinomycetota bacterium]